LLEYVEDGGRWQRYWIGISSVDGPLIFVPTGASTAPQTIR